MNKKASILKESPRREQGDYNLSPIVAKMLNTLDSCGFNLVETKNVYNEQVYYNKTVQRGTAFHGKYSINMILASDNRYGAVIYSSTDCQFSNKLFLGLTVGSSVLPMIPVADVKHLTNQVLNFNSEKLMVEIDTKLNELSKIVKTLEKSFASPETCIDLFESVNDYVSPWHVSPLLSVYHPSCNLLQQFVTIAAHFFFGVGIKRNGRKSNGIVELRRQIKVTQFMVNRFMALK